MLEGPIRLDQNAPGYPSAQAELSELEDLLDASKAYLTRNRTEYYLAELDDLYENYDLDPITTFRRCKNLIRRIKYDVYYSQQDIERRKLAIQKEHEDNMFRIMTWAII